MSRYLLVIEPNLIPFGYDVEGLNIVLALEKHVVTMTNNLEELFMMYACKYKPMNDDDNLC